MDRHGGMVPVREPFGHRERQGVLGFVPRRRCPDGEEVLRLAEEPDTGEVTLDLADLRALRRRWPLLREPRLDLVAREVQALMAEED